MAFSDDKIYYANFSGSNTLNSMNFDGSEDTVIFDEKAVDDRNVFVYGGKVYFVAGNRLYAYAVETKTAALVNDNVRPNEYILHEGAFYMMNDKNKNYFSKYDIEPDKLTDIEDLGITNDARSIFVYGEYVYFYRNAALGSSDKGLYKVKISSSAPTAESVSVLEGFNMANAQVVGDTVYFMDVWQMKDALPTPSSTGKLCSLNLKTLEVKEVEYV